MDLHRLRHFVVVSEELSFSGAARRLYVDQGTLSRSIKALERELGVTLLGRTSRKVWLTPEGAVLLESARELIATADGFRTRAASLAKGETHPGAGGG